MKPGLDALKPLPEAPQLPSRVYQSVVNGIISGALPPGMPLRPDMIAQQLQVSTTPVREALLSLEGDGVVIRRPYQGWFVRDFSEQQAREMYELRASLECLGVRLACERITAEEIAWLRAHQAVGEAAIAASDMGAYRGYNHDLHTAILRAARNSYLFAAMEQLSRQSEMLVARTIRLVNRPLRAVEEHVQIIECIARRDPHGGEQLMQRHILSALEDIIRYSLGQRPA